MPRIDTYPALASLADDDELIAWDTSAGAVVNVAPSVLATKLATNTAFSSRFLSITDAASTYLAKGTDQTKFISAASFSARYGSPTLSANYNSDAWLLDAASEEIVGTSFVPPSWWSTFTVVGYFANAGAGSGDVRVGPTVTFAAADAAISSSGASPYTVLTVGTQGVLKVHTLHTGVTVSPGLCTINVTRSAVNAADTLANDLAFIGVLLTPTA